MFLPGEKSCRGGSRTSCPFQTPSLESGTVLAFLAETASHIGTQAGAGDGVVMGQKLSALAVQKLLKLSGPISFIPTPPLGAWTGQLHPWPDKQPPKQ